MRRVPPSPLLASLFKFDHMRRRAKIRLWVGQLPRSLTETAKFKVGHLLQAFAEFLGAFWS